MADAYALIESRAAYAKVGETVTRTVAELTGRMPVGFEHIFSGDVTVGMVAAWLALPA